MPNVTDQEKLELDNVASLTQTIQDHLLEGENDGVSISIGLSIIGNVVAQQSDLHKRTMMFSDIHSLLDNLEAQLDMYFNSSSEES